MSTRENIRLIARASLVSLRQNYYIFIGYLKTGQVGGGGGKGGGSSEASVPSGPDTVL